MGSYIKTESGYVHMAVMGHNEQINFNVTPLGQYNVVLGIPWLRNHNPVIDWKHEQIEFTNCTCPQTDRSEEWDSGTSPQLTRGTDDYTKQLRDGLRMIRHIPSDWDAATNMIIAATKTSEQHWLRELLGWALKTTEEYTTDTFTEDITKRPDGEEYQLKDDQGSWELVDWQQFAATTDLEVPEEYERFQNLFNQPE